MRSLYVLVIAAVLLVGCGPSVQNMSIHEAAYKKDIIAIKKLLATGVDVNAKDDDGDTSLFIATDEGHKEVIELLIANGADVNGRIEVQHSARRGGTCLHVAAVFSYKEIAELLIAEGVDVNAKDDEGDTALNLAAGEGGSLEIVKLLIAKGVNVNMKNGNGLNPLHYAVYGGHKEIAELLIAESADVNGNNFAPSLGIAASEGYKEILELLLAKGADVNALGPNGETPLTLAAIKGHKEIAGLLRKHGAKTGEELKAEGK